MICVYKFNLLSFSELTMRLKLNKNTANIYIKYYEIYWKCRLIRFYIITSVHVGRLSQILIRAGGCGVTIVQMAPS